MLRPNQGSVLIVALLMIAFVEVIMLGMMKWHRIEIRYINNMVKFSQNYQLLLGGQIWAKGLIRDISKQKNNKIRYILPKTEISGRVIESELFDMQSLININSINKGNIISFENFLSALNIELNTIRELGILDSLQQTQSKQKMQSETQPENQSEMQSETQSNAQPTLPYLKSILQGSSSTQSNDNSANEGDIKFNEKFVSISELLDLSFPIIDYLKLREHIIVLPESMPLNINTASCYSLLMLDPRLTIEDTRSIIRKRDELGAFESIEQFFYQLKQISDIDLDDKNITLLSRYYLNVTTIMENETELKLYTLLRSLPLSNEGKLTVSVIMQSIGTL